MQEQLSRNQGVYFNLRYSQNNLSYLQETGWWAFIYKRSPNQADCPMCPGLSQRAREAAGSLLGSKGTPVPLPCLHQPLQIYLDMHQLKLLVQS